MHCLATMLHNGFLIRKQLLAWCQNKVSLNFSKSRGYHFIIVNDFKWCLKVSQSANTLSNTINGFGVWILIKCQCLIITLYGASWPCMGPYGSAWLRTVHHGCPWMPMGPHKVTTSVYVLPKYWVISGFIGTNLYHIDMGCHTWFNMAPHGA